MVAAVPAGAIGLRKTHGSNNEERLMEVLVPGHTCLFGEHSDWAGEYWRINPGIERNPDRPLTVYR
jgi:hypothetical protein